MADGSHVLLIEDHEESRLGLADALTRNGHVVHPAATGKAALAISRRETLHAAVLDLRLPDMDGLAVLEGLLDHAPGLPVVVVTAYATIDAAVAAMKRGAADFLTKPLRLDDLTRVLDRAIARAREDGALPPSPAPLNEEMERLGILGRSAHMREVFDLVKRIAPHYRTVLIQGESGTGKELVARALHALGPGPERPFVAVNCATLSEPLLESEIFGQERGAFAGADALKVGVMETAHTGTLFLDAVNEMGLSCQAKLLRAVERHEFRRVGGTKKIQVDLRVVGASNVSLEELVAAKRFRADLYYRLKVLTITLPPLRERREAIPVLAERFLFEVAEAAGLPPKRLTPAAVQALSRYDWPGNVRELRNTMESLTLLASGQTLDLDRLPANIRGMTVSAVSIPVGTSLADAERQLIGRTLEARGTVKETARVLGIGLRTLHTKLKLYGIRKRN
jgi:DNA-binding NtrC family response regulator